MDRINTARLLSSWLDRNAANLAGKFDAVKVNDWSLWEHQGITLDLEGKAVWGRFTAWADTLINAGGPVADASAIDAHSGEQFFYWGFEPLSAEFLDKWFAALEACSTPTGKAPANPVA